jgi:hypothetical protein
MLYRLKFDSILSFVDASDYAILKTWKNPSPIDDWQALKLNYQSNSSPQHVMGLHSIMIWDIELVETLSPIISNAFQALPVKINDRNYGAIHITQSIDCLDHDHSQFKRFKNRNIGVEDYVLRADCVGDTSLFTIPDDGYSAIFVSPQLKAEFVQHQWTGLSFIPITCR